MKLFVIILEIQSKEWDYKIGQLLYIPIRSRSKYHADIKFSNNYCGSEFPKYEIKEIHEVDNFIFSPKRFKNILP